MYLKVKDNEIVVTAPKKIKNSIIESFVSKNIKKFVDYLENKKENILLSIKDNFLYLTGKKYNLVILTGFVKTSLIIKGHTVYINSKEGTDEEVNKIIKKYLKDDLEKYISKMILHFEKIMNIEKHTFKVVFKTSTWGTNFIGKHKISFSSRLAHYRREITDYVIVHELAHTLQPNHQKQFWDIVKRYCHDYKALRNELKSDQALSE